MKKVFALFSLLLVSVSAVAQALTEVEVTATFPFNDGTEGQVATFGDQSDYFLSSKVVLGNNIKYNGKRTFSDLDWSILQPKTSTTSSVDADTYVAFMIQPKFGITFTPSSVSLKVAKHGTDNGRIDVAWVNADGTELTLATDENPARSSNNPSYSTFTYEVKGAAVAEGSCGLKVYVYGKLANNKELDFCDIVISGLLNGEEKAVPMLGSFSANGVSYTADELFEADGSDFVATIELSKQTPMISADNPLTAVKALSGEIGTISYEGDATRCVVTIPVSIGDQTINYVLTVVQKPDFTLTYVNTDGSVMGTQLVEKDAAIGSFDYDYTTATAEEGFKVRGWFRQPSGGAKYTVGDIITSDCKLYAVATEIEESSPYKKYLFDLTSPTFYAEDHEAFVPEGSGTWHDTTHGWVFRDGDRIALLVGEKAVISIALCAYSKAGATLVFTDAEGKELGTVDGVSESDGALVAFNYEGTGGTIYLTVSAAGAVYLHNLKITNVAETNFETHGNWYIVKAGDAGSFVDVLDFLNGLNASSDATRKFIFLPDGTYDLGYTALTPVSGQNLSIIGQSTEGTVIKNKMEVEKEGIGTTATLLNSSKDLYMQDLTLQNELDYYASGSAGRAVCFQDKGDRAIFKNVEMKSYQDTYYSQSTRQSYFESCNIHGVVDFICGGGDVRFQNCTLSLEARNANGTGGRTITAPTTTSQFGYVFDGCKIIDLAAGKGDWNYGRTWQNKPICVYLNTTLDANAAKTLVKSRWTQKGMNNTDPKLFGEYGTKNESGTDITPTSNIIASHGGNFQTILSADEAAAFSYEKMFSANENLWDPAISTRQQGEQHVTYADGVLTWERMRDGTIALAVFKNGVFAGIMTDTTMSLEASPSDVITVRGANPMGGLGKATTLPFLLPGDVNEDGHVDINDVVAVINHMAGTASWKNANVNGDLQGDVDINDVVAIINIMASK